MTELFAKLNKVDPNKGLITLQLNTDDIHTLEKYHASGQQQVVSGLTVLTVVYTDNMLRIYLVMGLTAIIAGILYSIAWAIDEVRK